MAALIEFLQNLAQGEEMPRPSFTHRRVSRLSIEGVRMDAGPLHEDTFQVDRRTTVTLRSGNLHVTNDYRSEAA